MDIIRENAGAESVVLVLESNGEFLVQGVKTASGVARVLVAEPLRQSVACSTGIVNYVLRTSELVVLDDRGAAGQVPQRRVRREPPAEVDALRAGCAQGQAHRRRVSREQPGRRRVHAGSARGAEHPDVADRGVDRERDALRQAGAAEPRDRGRQRDADEGDRRAQARREASSAATRTTSRTSSRSARASSRSAQGRLVDLSRRAGMAEVASGVLHNVGNVMNSVNVGASVAREAVKALPVEGRDASRATCSTQNAGRLARVPRDRSDGPQAARIPAQARRRARAGEGARFSATSTSSPSISST